MEVDLGELSFDIDFHPSENLLAAGLITGRIHLYSYGEDSSMQRLHKVRAHSESCRAVRFISDGKAIISGSADRSILSTDVESGSVIGRVEGAHEAPINRLVNLTEATIATGDDNGCIKVWDTRHRACCNSFNAHEEFISDITFASDSMKLVATSGDGSLSVCNLRSGKIQTRSEFSEEALSSVVIMKNGRKVICGTQEGTLLLYSWGFFKDCSDRFVDLSPASIDAMLKLDEDRIIIGTDNGLISLVGILPNRIIQPLAEDHSEDHSSFPIECLAFSHDKKYLGSTSHDHILKLWDLETLLQGSDKNAPKTEEVTGEAEEDKDSDSDEMDVDANPPPSSKKARKTKRSAKGEASGSANSFFADM